MVNRRNQGLRRPRNGQASDPQPRFDYERLASELVRSVRGGCSQAELSRRFGYRSSIVTRWEAGTAFPGAARFLSLVARLDPERAPYVVSFFGRSLPIFNEVDPVSREGVALFLRELRGKTPILSIARDTGYNRYSVSRWLNGQAEPRLPELLCLVEVLSRRLLDFLACISDPRQINAVTAAWKRLELTRTLAYDMPWSHAVLRALELDDSGHQHQKAWLAQRLGISVGEVSRALDALVRTGQVAKVGGRFRLERVLSVDTSRDRKRAHGLKVAWTRTAFERMVAGSPGHYGYTLFSVSRVDLRRLRELHLEYVRAMQYVIAASQPGECVGLLCAQLLDLAIQDNALDG
jgi:transcriptional regulator with XRE-family HTH domain